MIIGLKSESTPHLFLGLDFIRGLCQTLTPEYSYSYDSLQLQLRLVTAVFTTILSLFLGERMVRISSKISTAQRRHPVTQRNPKRMFHFIRTSDNQVGQKPTQT